MEAFPAEILSLIFVFASDEDVLFQHGLPTTMASSAWFKGMFGVWTLRSPNEALNVLQRRSYSTKRSIMMTCRAFHRVASELMFHCLFFNTPDKLPLLCAELDKKTTDPSPAWWSRRVHLTSYNPVSVLDRDNGTALCSVLRHCSNLEIAVLSIPTTVDSFMFLADTLCTYNKHTLRTLHVSVPISSLSKLIWMLASLPNLTCLHVALTSTKDQTTDEEEAPELGAAQDIMFTLAHLTQLSLNGHTGPFLEQACNWNFPSLRFLSLNTFHSDIIPFLDAHGEDLTFLDVTWPGPTRIHVDQAILRCPQLTTLCFNADWSFEGELTHERVHSVGLHGLKLAFSPPTSGDRAFPLDSMMRRANDANFASVLASGHFPKLERVRVLSGAVLSDLEKRGGPAGAPPGPYGYTDESEDGMKRWERWWDTCHGAGVRLEDCTGGELGILPGFEAEIDDEDDEDDEESDEEVEGSEDPGEEEEEDDEEEWEEYSWEYEVPPVDDDTSGVGELRKLIEECREMERSRPP
ncbi:hypothetical protein BDZ89DRAFT_1010859 [Hymenopellis radicata]|nr:hypothetical protein BDZ89DRAFT_1010859 [Hymenopellis radicata]